MNDKKNKFEDMVPMHFTEVEVIQEQYYKGTIDVSCLFNSLEGKIFRLVDEPAAYIEISSMIRSLKDFNDIHIPEKIFSLIDATFEKDLMFGTELWAGDAGRNLILDLLDIVFEYKRNQDIPTIMAYLSWDFFHVPSHIFMLIRKHSWFELWDIINARYDIREEYDHMIRTQHFLTSEAFANPANESLLLSSHQKELAALRENLKLATTPVMYVEGKTDRMILNTAYKKLFKDEPMPFVIKECDVVGNSAGGGSGGAQTLGRVISAIRSDSSYAALALFDNDKEGVDVYNKLPKYFELRDQPKYRPGKISKNRRSAALLIPTPEGKERYEQLSNLCIEFLFNEDVLQKKNVEGKGLKFSFPDLEVRVKKNGSPIVETMKSTIPETRDIVDGKIIFATEIVPSLNAEDFENFRGLFWKAKDILLSDMSSPESLQQ
ncbi:hypothetical protein [Vibrio owensii]|uniref:hypothetical protein n=1 Tax=Vibrio owensii TaxID=696485 RepID=UPI0038CD983C